jgi:arylsulfatase
MSCTRRDFLRVAAGGATAAATALHSPAVLAARDQRPNILFIFSDQEREMSEDRRPMRLPQRERLEAGGVRFTQHFCPTGQCSPSRATLLTGRWPHEVGIETNIEVNDTLAKPLDARVPSAGLVFSKAGYETAYFGKWHLGGGGPGRLGFGANSHGPDDKLAEQASDWIRSRDGSRPWMLWASYVNPHDIYHPENYPDKGKIRPEVRLPSTWNDDRKGKPAPQQKSQRLTPGMNTEQQQEYWLKYRSFYCDLMEILDAEIGQILDTLQKSKHADNTIVVYTSDHGDMGGAHGLGFKGPYPYDELLKIPLVVRWPKVLPEGVRRNGLTSHIDIIPTLCDLTGLNWPGLLRGQSLRPILESAQSPGHDAIFAEYFAQQTIIDPIRTIRTEQWKLNEYLRGEAELYDLRQDPSEMHNLAGSPTTAVVQAELQTRLMAWRKETSDPLLDPAVVKALPPANQPQRKGEAGGKGGGRNRQPQ